MTGSTGDVGNEHTAEPGDATPADQDAAPPEEQAPGPEEDEATSSDDAPPSEPSLIPQGNPLRWRSLPVILGGAVLAFVIMALGPQLRWGVPLGALGVAIATLGLLDLMGSFDDGAPGRLSAPSAPNPDDPEDRVAGRTTLAALAGPLALLAGGLLATTTLVTLAVAGYLPAPFDPA